MPDFQIRLNVVPVPYLAIFLFFYLAVGRGNLTSQLLINYIDDKHMAHNSSCMHDSAK
jgi:hypothetical protein